VTKVDANLKLATTANKQFRADFIMAKKGIAWASGSRKAGKIDFCLQTHYNKLMIKLHAEQVQNASTKFEKAASSFMQKCDGLL
jgi:hypothetical protein